MNVRGPCSSCGAQLATDQRYCIECGQRVGPPMALPYALPAPVGEPAGAGGWMSALPVPMQMASTFAAIALGFGVVVGTAISPNLAGIVAAPAPTVVAQAPPPETPPTPSGGGGGPGNPTPVSAAPAAAVSSTGPTETSGGNGGGKKKKKKKKKQEEPPITFDGTVVRVNQVAQSYTISSSGGLIAIHSDSSPNVGDQVHAPVRKLTNGTYAEEGARSQAGTADQASFLGTVTYCADLEQPSAPCDGSSATDHYAYTVSALGASVLVSAPYPAQGAPPKVGSQIQVGVHIGASFQPVTPASWATDPTCTPPYNEQSGVPASTAPTPELTQTSVTTTATATATTLEAVVQTVCPTGAPTLVLSADDIREAGRDLPGLPIPSGVDPGRLTAGEAVQAALDVAADGTLTLRGITSDQGTTGADDQTQGQGTLSGI